MKKIMTLLILSVPLLLIGCSKQEGKVDNGHKTTVEKAENKANSIEKEDSKDLTQLSFNEKVSDERFEITFVDAHFTKKIEPKNPADFSTYYEAEEPDSILIRIDSIFKNLDGETVDLESLSCELVVNDKYKYHLNPVYEEDGNLSILNYLKALEQKNVIWFAKVPLETKNILEKAKVQIGYNKDAKTDNMFDTFESKDIKLEFKIDNIKDS